MSKTCWTITPDQKIDACMALMTANRIRPLPVSEKDFIIKQFEDYIRIG